MKITILCVGRLKETFYRDAVREFEKRLSRYCRLEIIEVADEKTPDDPSGAEAALVKEQEGKRLLRYLKEDSYVICLAIDGKEMDSVRFSRELENLGIRGKDRVCFVIGGSLGLSEEVLKRADERLSFSQMTFPHQLMRVILLEQIYRACRIMHHEPYHK